MKKITHALEGAIIAALGYVPLVASSTAVRDFMDKHPADAVYLPLAVGILSAAYRWAKAKWGKPAAAPAAPTK